jgi:hypothetical protein
LAEAVNVPDRDSVAPPGTGPKLAPHQTPLIAALVASAILAVLIQAYAGATLRGVYADGSYFATRLAERNPFFHPARVMSSVIIQLPVMAAMRLGMQTPHSVALVFSVSSNLLPGLIILLCLPALPSDERHFFIFPAFAYFAGTLSAQFASDIEGLVATSYFWLLLCLITFGRLTIFRLALIAVLAVGSLRLHEQMSFLGPILVVACALRWRDERRLLPRIVLSIVALCSIASAVIGAEYINHPFSAHARDSFVRELLGLYWLYNASGCNLPCILGILAVPCILITMVRPAWSLATTWLFAAMSIALTLAALWVDWLIVPSTQVSARYNVALMSLPLAALLLFARVHTPLATAIIRNPARGIVVVLGLTVSLWHVEATAQWSAFLAHFSKILRSHHGIIAWDTVVTPPGSRQAEIAAKMVWPWTNPDLSLVALPRSCVSSVVANPTWYVAVGGWERHTISNLATMPAIPDVTYTYLLAPDRQRAACLSGADATNSSG